jgi:hypothetical protein
MYKEVPAFCEQWYQQLQYTTKILVPVPLEPTNHFPFFRVTYNQSHFLTI